jgi:hypothetical protein
VVCRDGDELRETALKALTILGPQQIVKEDPHSVEPEEPSHAQLAIDAPGIISARLKHLELIYRVCSDVVRADQPPLCLIPAVGAVNRPPARFGRGAGHSGQCRACCHKQRELKGRSTVHEVTIIFQAMHLDLHIDS